MLQELTTAIDAASPDWRTVLVETPEPVGLVCVLFWPAEGAGEEQHATRAKSRMGLSSGTYKTYDANMTQSACH
jgi:hypothetical protein